MNATSATPKPHSTLLDLRIVRGLILDAVGTLITPSPSVAEAYRAAAARQGISIDPDCLQRRFNQSFARDEIDERRGPLSTSEQVEWRRWRRIVAECLPEVPDPDRAFRELWAHFGQPGSWRVFPDARRLIETAIRLGLGFVVASNFDARLHRVLKGTPALAAWADSTVISSQVGFRKPHPEFYAAACRRLGIPAESVLHVGDDPMNDGAGARAAGLQALVLNREGRGGTERFNLDDLTRLLRESLDSYKSAPAHPAGKSSEANSAR
ncbi:MAG: hypothetical protein KatS3mg108_1247 [Isosphaeraceae bacterium]|jgi:putative hydrolase of the HAD superfamily|nr:MAG: hypothetical protein KatS3mg108_1247 [Isosphaeraceae bacterium]